MKLPTLAEVAQQRAGKPIPKAKSRLEVKADAKPLTRVDEKAFRQEVIARDGMRCRMCGKKVIKTLARVPERLEIHHIHGRTGDLRFDSRAALVLDARCHERVTGRVSERWIIVPTKTFTTRQGVFTDARAKVRFERVA